MPLKTPVAFLIFNRPELTQKVFDAIRHAKPKKLLVVADGPRLEHLGEIDKCRATREIIDTIDWDCEVRKHYSDINLGCGVNVSKGISWVFEQVEEAIILEDDCLPNSSFFLFCEELLDKYRDDKRVMMISGTNYLGQWEVAKQSYHFSYFAGIWGWASWRRAWKLYDYEMRFLPQALESHFLRNIICEDNDSVYWKNLFQASFNSENKLNTWDYQWLFTRWSQSGLGIVPNVNLVANLGFGQDATHTQNSQSHFNNLLRQEVEFPLKHPIFILRDHSLDQLVQKFFFTSQNQNSFKNRLMKIRERLIKSI